MQPMEIANALNTQGSAMMAAGNYAASSEAFSAALAAGRHSYSKNLFRTRAAIVHEKRTWKLATTHAYIDRHHSPVFEIFDHCFVATQDDEEQSPEAFDVSRESTESEDVMIAAMVYNFALAHHLAGYHHVKRQRFHFDRAHRLYTIAVQVLQKCECTEDSVKVCLAVSNNLAALSLEILDFDMFATCREWIGSLMATRLDEFHVTFFIDNFASVAQVHEWPAAAA